MTTLNILTLIGSVILPLIILLVTMYSRYIANRFHRIDMDHESLKQYLQAYQLEAADKYPLKNDVIREYENIMDFLKRIEDKLDRKADRLNV